MYIKSNKNEPICVDGTEKEVKNTTQGLFKKFQ